jgi:hypothetical protein
MIYLTFSTVMTLLGFQCPFILIQFGWFVSWTYLRFYKKNAVDLAGGGISYGDRSETFSFVNWFPPLLQCVLFRLRRYLFFADAHTLTAILCHCSRMPPIRSQAVCTLYLLCLPTWNPEHTASCLVALEQRPREEGHQLAMHSHFLYLTLFFAEQWL